MEHRGTPEVFREAIAAVAAGDLAKLEGLLTRYPGLVRERLTPAPDWLRNQVGDAVDGFFKDPYLLWFVAEDPVRTGKLPANIAAVAQAIITTAQRQQLSSLGEQLQYALQLVCWSWIARECGVQIALIDVLLDAGASPDGSEVSGGRYGPATDAAIWNGNYAAAEHLLARGAPLTLSTALCLGKWGDVERLAASAPLDHKQDAFVLAALQGQAEALSRMLALGVPPTTVSQRNYSHATALHHAVWSGSLEAVKVLVEAGADLTRRDTLYDGTPLGWASYANQDGNRKPGKQYAQIVEYLRSKGGEL